MIYFASEAFHAVALHLGSGKVRYMGRVVWLGDQKTASTACSLTARAPSRRSPATPGASYLHVGTEQCRYELDDYLELSSTNSFSF